MSSISYQSDFQELSRADTSLGPWGVKGGVDLSLFANDGVEMQRGVVRGGGEWEAPVAEGGVG